MHQSCQHAAIPRTIHRMTRGVILTILLAGLPVLAQTRDSGEPKTEGMSKGSGDLQAESSVCVPGQLEAAMELLDSMNVQKTVSSLMPGMVDAQVQRNPALGPYRDIIMNWSRKVLSWETVSSSFSNIYCQTFNEREMKELTAFYRTPTGQKALIEIPNLWSKATTVAAALARAHSSELQDLIRERKQEMEGGGEAH